MSESRRIRLLVADDHELVREGIVLLLQTCADFDVVAETDNGMRAVELFRELRPDVGLLDVRMPLLDGPEVVARLAPELPDARFIMLTTYDTGEDVRRALEAGAHGYLLKGAKRAELVEAVKDVFMKGVRRISGELVDRVFDLRSEPQLTTREREVLRLMAEGRVNAEIATALNIAPSTLKNHINSLLAKLGVTTRTQAVLVAAQRGLVRVN
jgi:two-component system NarL family response regulator